jgi:CubicO group peptidase (beta-lactamase class C family)
MPYEHFVRRELPEPAALTHTSYWGPPSPSRCGAHPQRTAIRRNSASAILGRPARSGPDAGLRISSAPHPAPSSP